MQHLNQTQHYQEFIMLSTHLSMLKMLLLLYTKMSGHKIEDLYDLFYCLQTSLSNSSGSDLIMLLVNYGKSQSVTQGRLERC